MKIILLNIFIIFLFNGCSLLDLKKDIKKTETLTSINVDIQINRKKGAQIVLALVYLKEFSVVDYRIVQHQDKTSFLAIPGKYVIYAFEDLDNNYKYSHGERVTKSDHIILYSSSEDIHNIVIKDFLSATPDEIPYMNKLIHNLKLDITNSSIHNGSIMPVNADIYNDNNIAKGLWKPYSFVFEVPFGIFLEKKYDPNKKVVLFVHGISGAPKNFEYLVDNLDKSKYQAIYTYYPSGASIYKVSEYLARVLNELYIRFDFDDISIIAHSMGGLASREMLNVLSKSKHDFVDTFITISSPLNGDKRANSGVEYSPVVMPVWRDMAHNSTFTKQLYKTPLSQKINYYLIFGVKSNVNTDGVVSIPTQLRIEAQKEAKRVRGYNESHMSILNSKEVSKYIYSILDENY